MYGLVNKAVEGLVCSKFGEDTWNQILEKAQIDADSFVSMEAYPDAVTYKLIGAACEVLKLDAATVLQTFGEYWTLYTVNEGYGELMEMFGNNLKEFLHNLDRLHGHVAMGFSELRPPSFRVEELPNEKALLLHYHSQREGLGPMVIGLVRGLAKRFGEEVEITHVRQQAPGQHDIFRIEFKVH